AAGGETLEAIHHLPVWVKYSPTVMMVAGFLVAWAFYIANPALPERWAARLPGLYRFLLNKWYFDELYDVLFVRPAFRIGRFLWKVGDGRIIDGLGPDGVARTVMRMGARVRLVQTGYIYTYAFVILIGIVTLTAILFFGGKGV
ncbi:MAG: NADH-quinone oxidoreductase subunit L, partial [Alphaproteobacteria bacterium]